MATKIKEDLGLLITNKNSVITSTVTVVEQDDNGHIKDTTYFRTYCTNTNSVNWYDKEFAYLAHSKEDVIATLERMYSKQKGHTL